ncbi:MAG: prolyl oligopeptidase family serine peptidase [Alphaproteobacteria bacterium]|nr:prolyl oligopeptidase family serine peptidase [Alphaproteobacteria bacterium]
MLAIESAADAQQTAGPAGAPQGVWRAQINWISLSIAGRTYLLYANVCRPLGDAPARVVVIAHGSPPSADQRPRMTPVSCDSEAAQWFLNRGFVVISAMRRGYGATGGSWAESFNSCSDADYLRAGLETARDLAATVDYAATLPYVRRQGIAVVGQSAGGWGTLAYNAQPHPRVTALINMAGGRGGHYGHRPSNNCRPDMLAAAAGQLARTASTRMLWIYTQNDSFFAPQIATALYTAYTRNGGKAEFYQLPTFDDDGHRLFFGPGGSMIWGPLVEHYLAAQPTQ